MNKKKHVQNVPASIRARLLNLSRDKGRPFQEVLEYYAIERFLYRLCHSPYCDRFTLKGALMFYTWNLDSYRPTVDIDLLGSVENSPENLESIFKEVCQMDIEDDGIQFHEDTIFSQTTQVDSEYYGVRVEFQATLDSARVRMKIDIGFGDVVTPEAREIQYPVLLDMEQPVMRGYPSETVVAEKLQTLMKHGLANSRMKDFYDIWMLAMRFDFDGNLLQQAIESTFEARATPLSVDTFRDIAKDLSVDEFMQSRWNSYVKKSSLPVSPPGFPELIRFIVAFIAPIINQEKGNKVRHQKWLPGERWLDV
jgi:predicted nucleotidyltransferase component of viral defense system